jgi:hypothetical protein
MLHAGLDLSRRKVDVFIEGALLHGSPKQLCACASALARPNGSDSLSLSLSLSLSDLANSQRIRRMVTVSSDSAEVASTAPNAPSVPGYLKLRRRWV